MPTQQTSNRIDVEVTVTIKVTRQDGTYVNTIDFYRQSGMQSTQHSIDDCTDKCAAKAVARYATEI